MDNRQFNAYIEASETLSIEYANGYKKGLTLFFKNETLETSSESKDFKDGYLTGIEGRPPKGFHGLIGRANNNKQQRVGTRASQIISFRVKPKLKEDFIIAAEKEGKNLSEWLIDLGKKAL